MAILQSAEDMAVRVRDIQAELARIAVYEVQHGDGDGAFNEVEQPPRVYELREEQRRLLVQLGWQRFQTVILNADESRAGLSDGPERTATCSSRRHAKRKD